MRAIRPEPTAPLLDYLFDRVIVTSKAIYDKYGPDVADRQHPVGAGPYKFRELIPGQRLVIGKDPSHPMIQQYPLAPDEIVFRIMREPEQRVGEREQFLLLRSAGLFRRVDCADPFRIDWRHGRCVEVSVNDLSVRVRSLPLSDERSG